MSGYLMMLLGATLIVAILTILSPGGSLSKSLRLATSIFLVCVLLSPMMGILEALADWTAGEEPFPWEESTDSSEKDELQSALNAASKDYFRETLTRYVEETFEIPTGDVRCEIRWKETDSALLPETVTLLLSGRGIWKDTAAIETHISELLGCTCITALE